MLSEHHIFSIKDNYFLFVVESMSAYKINKAFADKLQATPKVEDDIDSLDENFSDYLKKTKLFPAIRTKIKEKTSAKIEPVHMISLNISQSCNMRCIYCYGSDGEYGSKGFMSLDTALKSVDWLIKNSGDRRELVITFFGGEPLLNFSLLKKVVKYSKTQSLVYNKEIRFTITTNGTKFNEEINKFLNDNRFSVVVSYDGDIDIQKNNRPLKSKNYNHITLEKKVIDFLKSRTNNSDTSARVTITKNNNKLEFISGHLLTMGFKNMHWAEASTPLDLVEEDSSNYLLSPEERISILSYLDDLANTTLNFIKYDTSFCDRYLITFIKQLYKKRKKNYFCGVGRGLVGISKDGKVYPCHRFVGNEKMNLGDINTLRSIDQKLKYQNYGITQEDCIKCWARYFCGGGCLYENMQGVFNETPKPFKERCEIIKKSVELSIYIYSNLTVDDKSKVGILKPSVLEK